MKTTTPPAALAIGTYAAEFDMARLTPAVLTLVGRAVADTCACGLSGPAEEASVYALRYAQSSAGGATGRTARCWGRTESLPMELAALYNGVAAHVLDYDDVTSPLRGHPSVALLPALLALGEVLDAPGRALAAAYVVGFDVICKLSRAMALKHYAQGWHSTASIGGIGCAVACARLLGLDARHTAHAIGLAVAQAAGARANFGTHAKSFQAGHANTLGLRAALLAKEGFDASLDVLEGEFGYMALYGHGESLAGEMATLGLGPLELEREGIEVKKYPLCYATHRALDGMLDLRAEHGLTLDRVRAVHITTSNGALTPLIHPRPTTGLEAKFSMQYAMAAALEDGRVGLTSFLDGQVLRPEIQRFLPAVTTAEAEGALLPRWAQLDITLQDGSTLQRRVDGLRGSARLPLSEGELLAKLKDCIAWSKVPVDAGRFFGLALHLENCTARELVGSLCPAA